MLARVCCLLKCLGGCYMKCSCTSQQFTWPETWSKHKADLKGLIQIISSCYCGLNKAATQRFVTEQLSFKQLSHIFDHLNTKRWNQKLENESCFAPRQRQSHSMQSCSHEITAVISVIYKMLHAVLTVI